MSIYYPRIEDLKAVQGSDGWYVCDSFGVIDGPYESQSFAEATFHAEVALGHDGKQTHRVMMQERKRNTPPRA